MRTRMVSLMLLVLLFTACVSIPKQTITISENIGNDLKQLHKAHCNIITIHFNKIEEDINTFIEDVYAPYIIHYVLKKELKARDEGKQSIYSAIEAAGKVEGKAETENAINEMSDFLSAAREQIETKRDELLLPIKQQESELITSVNQSYENAIYANTTITAYLQSIRKVKEAQQEALTKIGLSGKDTLVTNTLVKLSEQIDLAVKQGKKIDIKSEDALKELDKLSKKIKELTTKK